MFHLLYFKKQQHRGGIIANPDQKALKSNSQVHLQWFLLAFICQSLHKNLQEVSVYKSHMPLSINKQKNGSHGGS